MTSPNPRGDMVRSLNICLICLSTLFMSLRFYVRGYMTKTLGIDDAFAFAAYVSFQEDLSHASVSNVAGCTIDLVEYGDQR